MGDGCSCGVDLCGYDHETADQAWIRTVRARKPHECGECGRPIAPGEQYERSKMLFDGKFDVYRTCVDCVSIRTHCFCDSWMYTSILEDLREHIRDVGYIGEQCIAPLTERAKDMVCAMIQEAWDEDEEAGRE